MKTSPRKATGHNGSLHATVRDDAKATFRNALLDAAEAVFAKNGFHGARIQDIAEAARVSVGTVYNHFADKDAVLVALMHARMSAAFAAFAPRADDPPSFEARFLARLGRIHDALLAHGAFFAVACDHGFLGAAPADALRHPTVVREEEQLATGMRTLIEQGIAEGALRDEDPWLLERFLAGALRNVGLHAMRGGADTRHAFDAVAHLFLRATRRNPEAPR